jgi:hypothetical protein
MNNINNFYSNRERESNLEKLNKFGLRDKYDQSSGLSQKNPEDIQISSYEHTLVIDTRDCIGTNSLIDAQTYFKFNGGRQAAYGSIINVTGLETNPITITFDSVAELKNGDTITIKNVRGNTNANGIKTISSINVGLNTAVISSSPNGNYINGTGSWSRLADSGYPVLTDKDSTVIGNVITVNLETELKMLRSLTVFHCVIPRDIIPLNYLLSDFISASTNLTDITYPGITSTVFTTLIPQEKKLMEKRILGFYSSPLDIWRTYTGAAFSMPNLPTPPPLNLWNPTGPGAWPSQPEPYPFQTVPTYRSNNFIIDGNNYYVILSGYGVYDLVDWTVSTGNPISDALNTSIIRKLLLILICPIQSYNDVDYISLILNSNTTSNINPTAAFGFGDYQRYVPGPGIGLNYQPNTNSIYTAANGSGPPNVFQIDSPISFPSFNGNVWGPYNRPGDRFQKLGIRDIVQDLYLNGDLNNLFGNPIILPNVPSEAISIDPNFGLNFSALITVDLVNFTSTTNPNIINAMRITPNGFGASTVRAQGSGLFYTSVYNGTAGGIGPSTLGLPSAWADNGIYNVLGNYGDPIAQGYAGPNINAETADATDVGNTGIPSHNTSYNDRGSGNGSFLQNIQNFINYTVNDIPDTDLIVKIEEAKRDERSQSTRSFNRDCLLDVPIRLNLGSTSGTFQYIESLQSLLAQATAYWQKRYINTKMSIGKLHLSFYDYEGRDIPLEKMLQTRGVSNSLQTLIKITDFFDNDFDFKTAIGNFSFIFDPLNPQLIGRVKRYIQIILKVEAYQGTPPGLEPTSMSSMQPNGLFDRLNYS